MLLEELQRDMCVHSSVKLEPRFDDITFFSFLFNNNIITVTPDFQIELKYTALFYRYKGCLITKAQIRKVGNQ